MKRWALLIAAFVVVIEVALAVAPWLRRRAEENCIRAAYRKCRFNNQEECDFTSCREGK